MGEIVRRQPFAPVIHLAGAVRPARHRYAALRAFMVAIVRLLPSVPATLPNGVGRFARLPSAILHVAMVAIALLQIPAPALLYGPVLDVTQVCDHDQPFSNCLPFFHHFLVFS